MFQTLNIERMVDPRFQLEKSKSLRSCCTVWTLIMSHIPGKVSGKDCECFYHDKMANGAGEMPQSLRALAALLGDCG